MLNGENDRRGQHAWRFFGKTFLSLGWDEGKNARLEARWYGGAE
jgi:hypothetical protein